MLVEDLDQLGKVGQRARQPVDLVDDDDVDHPSANVSQQLLEAWPLHVAAREATIVVAFPQHQPAFRFLAGDVVLAGVALGVERIEVLLEPFIGGLAGVDRAAEFPRRRHEKPRDDGNPKNFHPFHCVPVIARATLDSDV